MLVFIIILSEKKGLEVRIEEIYTKQKNNFISIVVFTSKVKTEAKKIKMPLLFTIFVILVTITWSKTS